MEKRRYQLPQIKLFTIDGDLQNAEKEVNQYIIDCFSKSGNTPHIRHSGNYISVVNNKLVETDYKPPQRTIPIIDAEDLQKSKPWWK